MSTPRADFRAGVRDALPVLVGIVPFGLVAGATAVDAGLSAAQAVGLSLFVFAGAAQLATIDLVGRGAPAAVVVVTALVINLRLMMYSASIAPYLQRFARRWRALLAYVLVDQVYAFSVVRYDDGDVARRAYYLGTAAPLWVSWQVATVAGVVLGTGLPAWLPLEFAVPLTFLALLVPAVEGRATGAAALIGGGIATLAAGAPFNAGLLGGAVAGVAAGVAAGRWA